MSALDRLIRLAQRTGDRLIVHDPSGENDLVIMGVDSYEQLLDRQTVSADRSWLEPEPWERKYLAEMEANGADEADSTDEFAGDMPWDEPSPWYSAAEVLGEKPPTRLSSLPFTWGGEDPLVKEDPLAGNDEPVFYEE